MEPVKVGSPVWTLDADHRGQRQIKVWSVVGETRVSWLVASAGWETR